MSGKGIIAALGLGSVLAPILAWFALYSDIKAFQREVTGLQWFFQFLEWIQHPPSLHDIITGAITAATPTMIKLIIFLIAATIMYYIIVNFFWPILEFVWERFLEPTWDALCAYILDPLFDFIDSLVDRVLGIIAIPFNWLVDFLLLFC